MEGSDDKNSRVSRLKTSYFDEINQYLKKNSIIYCRHYLRRVRSVFGAFGGHPSNKVGQTPNMSALVAVKTDIDFSKVSFSVSTDIQVALSNKDVGAEVTKLQNDYYTLNVADAMQKLSKIGQLLRVAYAASNGHRVNSVVVEILCDYQRLVKDSFLATGSFVNVSIAALKNHGYASKFAAKGDVDKTVKYLTKCGDLASSMISICDNLINASNHLCDLSAKAIKDAADQLAAEVAEEKTIKSRIDNAEAKIARNQTEVDSLKIRLKELNDDILEARKTESEESKRKFILALVGAVSGAVKNVSENSVEVAKVVIPAVIPLATGPVGAAALATNAVVGHVSQKLAAKAVDDTVKAVGKPEAQPEAQPEAKPDSKSDGKSPATASSEDIKRAEVKTSTSTVLELQRVKQRLYELELEANASLAENLCLLQNLNIEKNTLEAAITALDATKMVMGKVKTIFENTRLFWNGVKVSLCTV